MNLITVYNNRSMIVLIAISMVLMSVVFALAQRPENYVKWIPDGDTILLQSEQWVRLQGIDAPETGKNGKPGQYYGRKATNALRRLTKGRPLTIIKHGKDRYNRILGSCQLDDGTDVAEFMVRNGFAFYYPHRDHSNTLRRRLINVQREAMKSQKGFWPAIRQLSDRHTQWVVNTVSGRAFPLNSTQGNRISADHRVTFQGIWEVYWQGYSPARSVSNWPSED